MKSNTKCLLLSICINFSVIFSCNFPARTNVSIASEAKEIVTIYDYQIWLSDLNKKDLRDSTVAYIDTMNLYNREYWVFFLNDSIFYDDKSERVTDPYSYAIEKDSCFIGDVYCPNFDTIYLKYEDEEVALIVSHYDVENSSDEEMYVYWNHNHGLVALFNYPWGALFLYDRVSKKGFAKETFYDYMTNQKGAVDYFEVLRK